MTYQEIKQTLLKALHRIKTQNPIVGRYLEIHLQFDDQRKTFCYTGDEKLIADVLKSSKPY